jgi:homoserine O-acetyltransferase/O-succinyltransferase
LIGPGKAIDTEKLFVVASNMLGSAYGSTNGASLNPRSGRPYGPDFPPITVHDIVAAQKMLLDELGVRHLVAVAGPSYGGYQAFQWAVDFPGMMHAIAAVVTAPHSRNAERSLAELEARLATDPEWHGGHYYGNGGAKAVLTQMRFETLIRYGYGEQLAGRYPDKSAREQAIRELAGGWARNWDANSLVILRRATVGFDTLRDFVLYVLCRSDVLFPPTLAPEVMKRLAAAGVDARYFEIDNSDLGHSASGPEHRKWSPILRDFLAPLVAHL